MIIPVGVEDDRPALYAGYDKRDGDRNGEAAEVSIRAIATVSAATEKIAAGAAVITVTAAEAKKAASPRQTPFRRSFGRVQKAG